MKKHVLSLNCGSSSMKFNLFELGENQSLLPVIGGVIEEIGNAERSSLKYTINNEKTKINLPILSYQEALNTIFDVFSKHDISNDTVCAVGHRVVQGGDRFTNSVLVDDKALKNIEELIPLAPLHNSQNLKGITETAKLLPGVPQVAVFDTVFHGTIPQYAYKYSVPQEWYTRYAVRKYGFHGTSHLYVSRRAAKMLDIPYDRFNCITAHLGNGCSIAKICCGKSVDTSMGFTPLEGLVMGTRSGDIDPAVIPHIAGCLMKEKAMDEAQAYRTVFQVLNHESGLKALAGTNLMQDIRQKAMQGDIEAETIINIYTYRVAKYIGSYWATLPSCSALIFTAGVGENEGYIRKKILGFLESLEFSVDDDKNAIRGEEIVIAASGLKGKSPLCAMVIPTDEEIVIAYDALYLGYLGSAVPAKYPFE
jgi:acetate kinase